RGSARARPGGAPHRRRRAGCLRERAGGPPGAARHDQRRADAPPGKRGVGDEGDNRQRGGGQYRGGPGRAATPQLLATPNLRRAAGGPGSRFSKGGGSSMNPHRRPIAIAAFAALPGQIALTVAAPAQAQTAASMEAVIGNNFGHLPMFVGVEKGLFLKHGVDLKLKVVNTGTDMVNAMQKNEVQIGDMSVTTFLKARHAGSPFLVVGMIMNDATTAFADNPLAIVARKGSGIAKVEDLKGRKVGLAKEQTSDEYLKMVLARRGMKYADVNIENIMAPPALGPALAEGKV